jgi:Fe-S-cluster containining protein
VKLELNLNRIAKLSWQMEEENARFRTYLKEQDPDEIDAVVHALNDTVEPLIDCTKCGNCCKQLQPSVTSKDVQRLARRLGTSAEQVHDAHVEEMDGKPHLKFMPCAFLRDCKCTVYSDRPRDCRSFPYLRESGFTNRLDRIIHFSSICPIVFNVFERLKRETEFS